MTSTPSYSLAIILSAPPFGWFGLHHFYLGNRRRGALYLIFSWTMIPIGISLIESMLLIKRGRERFLEKYGSEEELEEYYVEQLKDKNPELLSSEVANHQARRVNKYNEDEESDSEDDDEDEEVERRVYEEPDYSEYYGNWE